MGLVWEAYQQGVPSLGVPENPTETCAAFLVLCVCCVFFGDVFTDSTIHKSPFLTSTIWDNNIFWMFCLPITEIQQIQVVSTDLWKG